jgi:altered-inheritance-of-mitochondria protein 5
MGFTAGFVSIPKHPNIPILTATNNKVQLGGITLTTSLLYLSAAYHRQNRLQQSISLSQQNAVLHNLVEPQPAAPPPRARMVNAGLVEEAKDRWNGEIEGLVRRMHNTDWNEVRSEWGGRIAGLVGRLREGTQKGKE